ncbi:MAG: aspartate--tRNA(Asn) ligase [Candidatus Nealsonbacteria bacterium]|nr:aspartate--tRNA(Asn) ligase [Candidatus Nealsonbacteria bacterium]
MNKRILNAEAVQYVGQQVKLCGWVNTRRDHGSIVFIDLRDISGLVQVVVKPELAQDIKPEWVVCLEGLVKERPERMINPKMETGKIEIEAQKLEILSKAKVLPLHLFEQEVEESTLEKRMNWRWLDLRRPKKQLIFKVWTALEQSLREYWLGQGYIEIHSPKFMSSPSESGAELFEVKYFNRKAYLAQSPQFYKQMAMASGFEKIFEVGPVFRANPSFTSRHDTEFTGYDAEISFIESHLDVIAAEEEALAYALGKIEKKYGKEIEENYGRKLIAPKTPFPQITMADAKKILAELKVKSEKEGDLTPEEERKLSEWILKERGHEFVFVTEYPKQVRPFYHMRLESDPKLTKSFDLLWNGLEITTGAQREHRYEILAKQAKEKGLKLEGLKHYLNFFKYGCPPHGGFGLGPSRMLMKIFNINNVREVTYIYRGVKRLTP